MKKYFEGWYYKLVDQKEHSIIAIIPGLSFDPEGLHAHAFIQIIDGFTRMSRYIKYDIKDFWYSPKEFEIIIGSNYFSSHKIAVNIADEVITLQGTLIFHNMKPWSITLLSPGAMGWYSFVPFMECYHGVLSFDHSIEGKLEMNGKSIDFTGGRGYTEKDWGRSFPRYHVWLQTNHFDTAGTSLMVSIANIPWFGNYFDGFIAGLHHNNCLYKFATYTGAKLTILRYEKDQLTIQISSKRHQLNIAVTAMEGTELRSPVLGDMGGRLSESLQSRTFVSLREVSRDVEKLIFQGIGRHTGLEIAGKPQDIDSIHVSI